MIVTLLLFVFRDVYFHFVLVSPSLFIYSTLSSAIALNVYQNKGEGWFGSELHRFQRHKYAGIVHQSPSKSNLRTYSAFNYLNLGMRRNKRQNTISFPKAKNKLTKLAMNIPVALIAKSSCRIASYTLNLRKENTKCSFKDFLNKP